MIWIFIKWITMCTSQTLTLSFPAQHNTMFYNYRPRVFDEDFLERWSPITNTGDYCSRYYVCCKLIILQWQRKLYFLWSAVNTCTWYMSEDFLKCSLLLANSWCLPHGPTEQDSTSVQLTRSESALDTCSLTCLGGMSQYKLCKLSWFWSSFVDLSVPSDPANVAPSTYD